MTPSSLLSINTPERLFPGDSDAAKRAYRALAKTWHPDVCSHPDARRVFDHVTRLHDLAQKKIASGSWGFAGHVELVTLAGSESIRYLARRPFELGECLIARNEVVYLIKPEHPSLGRRFIASSTFFRYGSERMKREVERYLPVGATVQGRGSVVRVPKNRGLVCLRDVLDHHGGILEPRHAAWILSSLYNLCCYFEYAGFAHNDISPDTYFIDPVNHSGALLGGWWYATRQGEPMDVVPTRTFKLLPWKVRTTKRASRATDAELVLAVGRELLGDITGKNLSEDTPRPMRDWLTSVGKAGAIDNYRRWGRVLEESFGERRFIEMELSSEMLYPINS